MSCCIAECEKLIYLQGEKLRVTKDYLISGGNNPNIDLNQLITKDFYTTYDWSVFTKVHFIPATMYEEHGSAHDKGLDDLEIDIVRNYANKVSALDLVTLFSKFFIDTGINEMYDFILFDCPPANNVITQNALIVSDYYLIPTIMDDISSNGINHLINVIENSVYQNIYNDNQRIIDRCDNGNKLFDQIIYHHKPMADSISKGRACFSENINSGNPEYSPHNTYGNLVLSILSRLGIPKTTSTKTYNWL